MTNRQKDAATHVRFPWTLISVSAVALLIGIGPAAAQGGSARQAEHNIEKQKDEQLLTPIRPLPRKVGGTSWPDPKPEAQREANERKAAAARETTGQSVPAQTDKPDQPSQAANNQQGNTPQPAQAASTNQPQPAQQQPAAAHNGSKPQQAQSNQPAQQPQQSATAPASQPSQNTAQNVPAPNNAQPTAQTAQQPAPQTNPQQAQNNPQQAQNKAPPDHASIRLGTDASGKVAINEDQEQELARAFRRARATEVNVGVQIGGPAPAGVRLAAVSADVVKVLPQFRGYSYFATAEQVYIVDPAANRVVAMIPIKVTATVKREAPARTTVGRAQAAQPEPDTAPATTGTVAASPAPTETVAASEPRSKSSEPRSRRSTRRGDDLAGIEAAIEREVRRKGLDARASTVVVEEAPAIQRVPTRRWQPWFARDVQ